MDQQNQPEKVSPTKNMAKPHHASIEDLPPVMQTEDMNEDDARASGYINQDGKAVSMAKKDVEGSPTGALTDVGAGRSSAVRHAKNKKTIEPEAPDLGDEQAP